MARNPRFVKPKTVYEITARTVEGRRLFRPTPALRKAVLDVLGRAIALFGLDVFAFIYLSNHLHLLAKFMDGEQMRGFMRHLGRNTAASVKAITGWSGDVWERYQPIPVLDDTASIRRLRYILSNGVKEGLVEHPLDWPGPSSAHSLVSGEPIETEWVVRPPGGTHATSLVIERSSFELTPLPSWAALSPAERSRRARRLMDDVAEEARQARSGKPVLGIDALRGIDPFEPTPLEDTPAPLAHFSDEQLFLAYKNERAAFLTEHRRSGARQSLTRRPALYPPFGFPAALPYKGDD